ncbi:MAG: AsmA family protein, partial [Deltaproteobacteria bacterium]|nr:AsmA family protein [Deltaproteobacteria bacterium]
GFSPTPRPELSDQQISHTIDLTAQKQTTDQPLEEGTNKSVTSHTSNQAQLQLQEAIDTIGLNAIKINGLLIENSQISWNDQQSEQHLVVTDFNLSSGAVDFNRPIAIKSTFLLENPQSAVSEYLALSTSLVIDKTLQKIQLKNFKLDSETRGESFPGGTFKAQILSEIALDLHQQTLALKNLQINTDSIKLTGNIHTTQLTTDPHYIGAIQIAEFNPKNLLQQLAIQAPETSDKQVLQKLAISFDMQGTSNTVALDKLKITLDDTKINGYAHIKQFNQPEITFQLAIDDIDLDRYSMATQKTKPVQSPIANTQTTDIKEAALIPADTLRILNINGDLSIAKLKVAKLKMTGVSLNIQAKNGLLRTKHKVKQLYQGGYQGQVTINTQHKTPRISLNEKIAGVQLEPLLNDLQPNSTAKIKGRANITTQLKAHGNTMSTIKSGLGGRLKFSLEKGAIKGFNLQEIIDIGKLAIKGKEMKQSYANEQTLFNLIKGTATIKNGLINNPDFQADSSTIEAKGKGAANLVTEALDYKIVAKAKKGGKNITNRPIAINIQGTFSEPSYNVDLTAIESMMTEKEKQKVDKFINKHEKDIDKALGEGSGKAVKKLLKGFFK